MRVRDAESVADGIGKHTWDGKYYMTPTRRPEIDKLMEQRMRELYTRNILPGRHRTD